MILLITYSHLIHCLTCAVSYTFEIKCKNVPHVDHKIVISSPVANR